MKDQRVLSSVAECLIAVKPVIVPNANTTMEVVSSIGLTKLELNSIKGPTAIQYDEMLEALTNLQHLCITKVWSWGCMCIESALYTLGNCCLTDFTEGAGCASSKPSRALLRRHC